MASPAPPMRRLPGLETTMESLTSDLQEEIFLRIGSPADLTRASIACAAFRRLIVDPAFLRRYRSLHPPQLLGFIDYHGRSFQPVEAPHPSAAVARAVARTGDFSFDNYLPSGTAGRWRVHDVRDGRVLLVDSRVPVAVGEMPFNFDLALREMSFNLAVCDPLAQGCLLLPPIPDGLLASVQVQNQDFICFDAFLVPSMDEEDDTSFKVIAGTLPVAFIFSSITGEWSAGTPIDSDALSIPLDEDDRVLAWSPSSYTYGCFYCKVKSKNKCFKFDMSSMEFSAVDLPPGCDETYFIIVDAGEGRLGMFTVINDDHSVCYTTWQIGGETPDQLKMDKTILPLPVHYSYLFAGPFEGHIIISGYKSTTGLDFVVDFALEIKTLKIERACETMSPLVYPYFGFPPFMSQRRI